MRNLLGNNCAKGCMVYLVALVAVVLLTSMGLGSLGSRFGVESQSTQISPMNVPGSQQLNPVVQRNQPASANANTQANSQPAQPPAQAAPTPTSIPIQTHSGTISGEASDPF